MRTQRDRDEGLAIGRELERKDAEIDRLRKLDREAAEHVECVICMRTGFTGEPPYVGWNGLGLALNEALDERDAMRMAVKNFVSAWKSLPVGNHSIEATQRWLNSDAMRDSVLALVAINEKHHGDGP